MVEQLRISSAHPLADNYFNTNEIPFPNQVKEVLRTKILKQLNLNLDNLNGNIIYRKQESNQIIGIVIDAEWDEIEEDRLKYCFMNVQLKEMEVEHINAIRQVTYLDNEDKLKLDIAKIQRILQSYLNEIIDKYKLDYSDLNIKIKKKYTNKDCAALIYKSIVVVLDFISTTFYEYMDFSRHIPYYSKLLNENNFVTKAKQIVKKLNKIELDKRLYLIIEAELSKVLNFKISNRITFQEFEYYKRFLKRFNNFLEKQKFMELEQDDVIHFLVSLNFRKQSFFEYTIDTLISTLNDFEDFEEKDLFLLTKKSGLRPCLHSFNFFACKGKTSSATLHPCMHRSSRFLRIRQCGYH